MVEQDASKDDDFGVEIPDGYPASVPISTSAVVEAIERLDQVVSSLARIGGYAGNEWSVDELNRVIGEFMSPEVWTSLVRARGLLLDALGSCVDPDAQDVLWEQIEGQLRRYGD